MTIASLLVHLDSSPRCAVRTELAAALAKRLGASLTGLFAETSPAHRVGVVATWPSRDHVEAAAAAAEAFAARTTALGAAAVFVDVDRGGEQEILARATAFARHFDLVVLGGVEAESRVPVDLGEQIVLESGRPVLMVPPIPTGGEVGRRPLFAWQRSRGAARALSDALPLVQSGADALVVHVARRGEETGGIEPPVIARLATHGITARMRDVTCEEVRLMDELLNEAADHGADLLVIGAFDHAGSLRIGGGAGTRYLMRHQTVPILFSH